MTDRRPFGGPIEPREWTMVDRYAVRTRSVLIATEISAALNRQHNRRAHARCRNVEFMTVALFEARLQRREGE